MLLASPTKQCGWYETLYPDQRDAADFILSRIQAGGGAALLSEQGTGKTHIALAVMESLHAINVLIVCPKTAIRVTWGKRVPSWYPSIQRSGLCIVSYDHFRTRGKLAAKTHWDLVIFDESQMLKDRNSAQSRAARQVRFAHRRLILSGTPVDECPSDLWAQMRFVDVECFGDKWQDFDRDYLYPSGYMGYERTFRKSRLPKFLRTIEPYCYRIESKLEAPKLIHVPVKLDAAQRVVYDEMATHGLVQIQGKTFTAEHAAVKDLKCFQIVGGFLHQHGEVARLGDSKLRALKRLLPKLHKPVVFCRFLEELKDVERELKAHYRNVAVISGRVTDAGRQLRRTKILEDFQAGAIDALAVQTRTGGVSVEFSSSYECVFYSMGYSYIDFQQIIARFRRIGQTRRVLVYLLTAISTVDEAPYETIVDKTKQVKVVTSHLEEKSKCR